MLTCLAVKRTANVRRATLAVRIRGGMLRTNSWFERHNACGLYRTLHEHVLTRAISRRFGAERDRSARHGCAEARTIVCLLVACPKQRPPRNKLSCGCAGTCARTSLRRRQAEVSHLQLATVLGDSLTLGMRSSRLAPSRLPCITCQASRNSHFSPSCSLVTIAVQHVTVNNQV